MAHASRSTGLSLAGVSQFGAEQPTARVSAAATAAAAPDAELGAALDEILDDPRLKGSMVSLVLRNRATTGTAGSDNTISVDRRHASKVVVISGSMPLDDTTQQDWATVPDPSRYAGDVFRRALKAEGITVTGRSSRGTPPHR